MSIPPHIYTNPLAGVTATNPATIPDAKPNAVGLPLCNHSTTIHPNPAAAAAAWVAAKADPARLSPRTELPPLKPNQPNHRSPAPSSVNTMLLGCATCWGYP